MSGALASPRSPGAVGSPRRAFAPSCKGCESVFSTEIQGVFQIGDRTVSLHAHVKATRTVSPPRPFTSAAPPPRLHRSRPCQFVFSSACFLHLFWSKSPRWQGRSAHEASIFTHFLPRKIPSFFHFIAKTRNHKNRRKSPKNVRKVQKQKNRPQTRQKAEKPSANAEKSGTAPKSKKRPQKNARARKKTRRGNRFLSVECILQSNAQKPPKTGKNCSARSRFVGQATNPAQKAPNVLSRRERAPKSLTARPNRPQALKGVPKSAKTAGAKKGDGAHCFT